MADHVGDDVAGLILGKTEFNESQCSMLKGMLWRIAAGH